MSALGCVQALLRERRQVSLPDDPNIPIEETPGRADTDFLSEQIYATAEGLPRGHRTCFLRKPLAHVGAASD